MKKKLSTVIPILVFLFGFGVLLYPTISDAVNARSQTKAIADYSQAVSEMQDIDYQSLLEQAYAYNEQLTTGKLPFANESDAHEAYQKILRVEKSEVMGALDIPSIDVHLPIYHGTGDSVLQSGVGHLEGTSLPVGGESTHAVLSGHRGLPSSVLFTNLDKMAKKDIFTVSILDQTFTYQVDQIVTVNPEDVQHLEIVPGEDYLTLLTCTPYGQNTQRLLVRGVRIANAPAATAPRAEISPADPMTAVSVAAAVLLVFTMIILLMIWHRRHRTPSLKHAERRRFDVHKRKACHY